MMKKTTTVRSLLCTWVGCSAQETRQTEEGGKVPIFLSGRSIQSCDVSETHTEEVVESREGLQEDVGSLVGKLVASGDEEVEGLIQVEVQVPARGNH